jgi:N-acetylneuraminate synthase
MSVFIIAEAGVNHNGSLNDALQLVDVAVAAGADAVKFQTFKTEKLVTRKADKAQYQKQATRSTESQFEMLQKLELSHSAHLQLRDYCQQQGIEFLSTAFDFDSLTFLVNEIGINRLKIPSGEITNGPFLLAHALTGKPIILSTGMATLGEIETALGVLAFAYLGWTLPCLQRFQDAYASSAGQVLLKQNVTLLHCTSEYPTPPEHVHLRAMTTLQQAFGLAIGYSDHTEGSTIPIAATACGANIIEKHFTLDRSQEGPDHKVSLEPMELKQMISAIRHVELAMGSARKTPQAIELQNRDVARKSLVAACEIDAGDTFDIENVTCKRPGTGLSPMMFWQLQGQKSRRHYQIDELIE